MFGETFVVRRNGGTFLPGGDIFSEAQMSPWTFFPRNHCPGGQWYLGKIVQGTACLGKNVRGYSERGGTEFPTTEVLHGYLPYDPLHRCLLVLTIELTL